MSRFIDVYTHDMCFVCTPSVGLHSPVFIAHMLPSSFNQISELVIAGEQNKNN